ncbi:hypothetical protein [Actinomyces sp. MRS3W]|uniref:hypothetical protein n=1 Tax=Actinomyces sp. MRS3W TaxID=2800796 RepID=UPI0028FD4A55|nr:hypothetical protein [Actinomyces sp. MRS3W]MDU0349344.1 hypothetical protein [Actinomyces sp. MRS3W]
MLPSATAPHQWPDPAVAAVDLALTVGERYPVGERMFTLTPKLAHAVVCSRAVLIDVAAHGEVITYGELSDAIGGVILPRHMGPLMHMLGHDCTERDEPMLPALVINRIKGEVGTVDAAWAPAERRACWEYWAVRS